MILAETVKQSFTAVGLAVTCLVFVYCFARILAVLTDAFLEIRDRPNVPLWTNIFRGGFLLVLICVLLAIGGVLTKALFVLFAW